jgi:hypothetical protein
MPQTRSQHPKDPTPNNPQLSALQQQKTELNSKLADVLTPASLPTFLTTLREQLRIDTQQQINAALSARPTSSVLGPHPQPTPCNTDIRLASHCIYAP